MMFMSLQSAVDEFLFKTQEKLFAKSARHRLITAIREQDILQVALLIRQNVKINKPFKVDNNLGFLQNHTFLSLACTLKDLNIVDLLLGAGADPNVMLYDELNGEYHTPLRYCIKYPLMDYLALMLQHGGDPNHYPKNGQSPLMEAIVEHNKNAIDLIRQSGGYITKKELKKYVKANKTFNEKADRLREMMLRNSEEFGAKNDPLLIEPTSTDPVLSSYLGRLISFYNIELR